MSADRRQGSENALAGMMRALQVRLDSAQQPLPLRALDLYRDLGRVLRRAVLNEVLVNGEHQVNSLFRMSEPDATERGIVVAFAGGPKDFNRLTAGIEKTERFIRDDGAVIHFTLTVLESPNQPLKLIAYDYEIYFPEKQPVGFLRFDMNPVLHDNADRGLRAHIHPSHEDIQLPSPVLSPVEALNFLLYRCRLLRDVPRT